MILYCKCGRKTRIGYILGFKSTICNYCSIYYPIVESKKKVVK